MTSTSLRSTRFVSLAAASGAFLAFLWAPSAWACGGFFCDGGGGCSGIFCDGTAPVDQTGEHLLFAVEQDASGRRTVVAHIQVQYQGTAADFAWILPLPSAPLEMRTGSNSVFTALRRLTDPTFSVNWLADHGCDQPDRLGGASDFGSDGDADADADADADGDLIRCASAELRLARTRPRSWRPTTPRPSSTGSTRTTTRCPKNRSRPSRPTSTPGTCSSP
jgi:hypothetical protein